MHDCFDIYEQRRVREWGGSGFSWELIVEMGEAVPEAVFLYGLDKTLDRSNPAPWGPEDKTRWIVIGYLIGRNGQSHPEVPPSSVHRSVSH